MRRERWPTREERERTRAAIEEAGGISAWIRSGKLKPAEQRERMARMNALAIKCGMNPPYPEIETPKQDEP